MQHRSRYSSTQGRKEKSLRLSNISGVSSEHVVTAKLPLNRARPVSNPEQSVPNVTSGLGAEWMTTAAAASGGRKRLRFSPPSFHRRGRRREEGREDKSCLFGFFSITLSPLYLSLSLSPSLSLLQSECNPINAGRTESPAKFPNHFFVNASNSISFPQNCLRKAGIWKTKPWLSIEYMG